MNKYTNKTLLTGIVVGALIGAGVLYLLLPTMQHNTGTKENSDVPSEEPLYWVAPMDPNFKRDQPGKSPMGMDLVPVFAEEAQQESPGTVNIDPVTVQNLGIKTIKVKAFIPNNTIRTFGQVHFAKDNMVHIHPRVEGWIEALHVRTKGESVDKGEPLYSLYAPDLVNAQEELLIALEQGNRALINAAQSRLRALNAPASLIENIQKKREVERTITFYAPQSGFISELNIQEGFFVQPSTSMLAIASMETVWVLADIFASDVSKIKTGQSARITTEYLPNTEITAQIDYIYPTLNEKTRTASARLVVANPELQLRPDMFADVTIDARTKSAEKVIAVPIQAVIKTGQSNRIVLALGDGKYKSIKVKLGTEYDDAVEVIEGIREGDDIVISAQFLLDSESSITSDLMRMMPVESEDNSEIIESASISAWTQATVNEVLADERKVNLTHGYLDAFDMMGMTMNFMVAEDIDITQFKDDMVVHVEIVKSDSGMFEVKTVHFMDEGGHAK